MRAVIENARYPNHCISPGVVEMSGRKVAWSDGHPLNNCKLWLGVVRDA